MEPLLTPGRIMIILGNVAYSGGAWLADWNETHVFNPNWPPHARFHNGQTLSVAICGAVTSAYFALRPALTTSTIPAKESLLYAAVIGSFYCFSGVTSILYPGANWSDPEYPHGGAQKIIFPSILAAIWAGYFLEASRLGKTKTA